MQGQQTRLADYCAVAMFIHQLLSRGYRFDERSFSGVVFEKKVGKWRGQEDSGCGLLEADATTRSLLGRRHGCRLGAGLYAEFDQPDSR